MSMKRQNVYNVLVRICTVCVRKENCSKILTNVHGMERKIGRKTSGKASANGKAVCKRKGYGGKRRGRVTKERPRDKIRGQGTEEEAKGQRRGQGTKKSPRDKRRGQGKKEAQEQKEVNGQRR